MFALEVVFQDGISNSETIFVRRMSSTVGSGENSHVIIEGIGSSPCDLKLVKGIGREFRCQPARRIGTEHSPLPFLEGTYSGEADLRLAEVALHITSLDIDLCIQPEESPDRAAIRVLRRALLSASPLFPAVKVSAEPNNNHLPFYLSFAQDNKLLIGRSRNCGLRLDAGDVANEHAVIGIEEGSLWIEDLDSPAGTFVNSERVKGRRFFLSSDTLQIGKDVVLSVIMDMSDIRAEDEQVLSSAQEEAAEELKGYPAIVTNSDLIRPSRFVLSGTGELRMGRDPASDIWINALHISRQHLTIKWSGPDDIIMVDSSSNGTFVGEERLERGVSYQANPGLTVIDFCAGVRAAICLSAEDESQFFEEQEEQEETEPETSPEEYSEIPEDLLFSSGRDATIRTQAPAEYLEEEADEVVDEESGPLGASDYSEHYEAKPLEGLPKAQAVKALPSAINERVGKVSFSSFSAEASRQSDAEISEELSLPDEFEYEGGGRILKFALISLSFFLLAFCATLVVGLFTNWFS